MRNARFWVGIGISVACLYLCLRGIDLKEVVAAAGDANWGWLAPAVALIILGLVARAARWGLLFRPQYNVPLGRLFSVMCVGYLVSNIFPARLGDVARAYLISRGTDAPVGRGLSTVIVERLSDCVTVVILLVCLLPYVSIPEWLGNGVMIVGVGCLCLVIAMIAITWRRDRGLRLVAKVVGLMPGLDSDRWIARAASVIDGFRVLSSPRMALGLFAWSVAVWGIGAVGYYLVLQSFDLRLSLMVALFVECVVGLGAIVPSSPGYIGVFHYTAVVALGLFGVERAPALTYAVVLHAINYLVLVALGLLFLTREAISIGDLRGELTET